MTEVGQTLQLNATVYPENTTNKTVTWISSDPEVASVDQNGLVTVHKKKWNAESNHFSQRRRG